VNDIDIINDILKGNNRKYELLVDAYQRQVMATCMGFVHHRDDAMDLTQEVFVKAYRALATFQGKASFATWIYRIAVNTCLEHLRKKKKKQTLWLFDQGNDRMEPSHTQTPQHEAEQSELQLQLQSAIDSLPENQRIAFVLSKYDELPQAEIARVMMMTEGAVESLLQRAKKNLQKKLSSLAKEF